MDRYSRGTVRATCTAAHSVEPCGVGTRRSVSALAMPLSEVIPLDCRSRMMWARSAALSSERADCASRPAFRAARESRAPLSPPSATPRLLAAARAALVRPDIARRSSSATIAMMPTVNRFACGMSAATKSTPAFSSTASPMSGRSEGLRADRQGPVEVWKNPRRIARFTADHRAPSSPGYFSNTH